MKPTFYLFLDCDGVLHPAEWRDAKAVPIWPLFSCLPLIESVLRPHLAELAIVISSSWRLRKADYRALLDALSDDVRARVIGMTPRGTRIHDARADEIRLWLEQYGEPGVTAVVLDDVGPHGYRTEFADWGIWIQVDNQIGFSNRDAARLRSVLDSQG